MIERGMIFNGEMVRSILNGRKTQTRRPIKFPFKDRNLACELSGNELAGELNSRNYLNSPFGKPGDRIWVRETWQAIHEELNDDGYVDETTYAPAIQRKRTITGTLFTRLITGAKTVNNEVSHGVQRFTSLAGHPAFCWRLLTLECSASSQSARTMPRVKDWLSYLPLAGIA
jgi:hypothetical protein